MIYMCEKCEMVYGRPKEHPECDSPYCGRPYEEVKDKV